MYRGAYLIMPLALLVYGGVGLVMSAKVQTTIPDEEYAINSALINDLFSVDAYNSRHSRSTSFFGQP